MSAVLCAEGYERVYAVRLHWGGFPVAYVSGITIGSIDYSDERKGRLIYASRAAGSTDQRLLEGMIFESGPLIEHGPGPHKGSKVRRNTDGLSLYSPCLLESST